MIKKGVKDKWIWKRGEKKKNDNIRKKKRRKKSNNKKVKSEEQGCYRSFLSDLPQLI